MTLRDCDHGRYAAPVHVEAEFHGSVQARGRRVPGRVHMGLLLAGIRELGPDEYHHWLDHVRNFETCTGPFVKTLIAQLIYLMLCGIRLIAHGTRLTRVCIFRYTWAGSCHGWNVYGTRRPRVCGIPCVSASRVPAGRAPRTHEGRVCRPPANWGQACTAKAPPGTRPPRVSCNRANSAQVCTGTGHRPHSRGPSLRRPCKLAVDVYRRRAPAYSSGLSLRTRCKLGAGVYPGLRPPPHAPGSSLRNRANWGRVRTRGAGALARTRHDLARSCKLAADVCRQPAWHEAPAARYPSTAGTTPVARISSRAASSSTGTPSCCAFFSFEPAASPATT